MRLFSPQQRHLVPVPRPHRGDATALREHGVSAPPSLAASTPPPSLLTPLSAPCSGEQCGGCRRSNATDRPHSFQVILNDRPSLELSADNEEDMADWMQYLCQAVSKGVSLGWAGGRLHGRLTPKEAAGGLGLGDRLLAPTRSPGEQRAPGSMGLVLGPLPPPPPTPTPLVTWLGLPGALLPALSFHLQVVPQCVVPAPCIPCCLVMTAQKVFTCHEDCQTSFFRSLASATLAEVASVSSEAGREYCILVSGQKGTPFCGQVHSQAPWRGSSCSLCPSLCM